MAAWTGKAMEPSLTQTHNNHPSPYTTTTTTPHTGLPSLCCTGAALLRVMHALGWHPSSCRRLLALAALGLLWAAIPAALLLGLYPVAGAALLIILAVEALAACRLRQVVRRRFNIDGSACQDGLLSALFTSCVTAQMLRHLRTTTSTTMATAVSSGGNCSGCSSSSYA